MNFRLSSELYSYLAVMISISDVKSNRFGLVWLIILLILITSFATRVALLIKSISLADFTLIQSLGAIAIGTFFDLVQITYFVIPLLFYSWFLPERLFQSNWNRFLVYGIFSLQIFLLSFSAVSEWFFWDEFTTRFNFIAVDYLVYTTEVVGNIRESYPIEWIVVALLLLAVFSTYLIKGRIDQSFQQPIRFKERSVWSLGLLSLPVLSFILINNTYHNFSSNSIANELAGNGIYELFAAYRNNELDYDQFYQHLPELEAQRNLEKILSIDSDDSGHLSITRKIVHEGSEHKLNIVLISIESFSAEFMGIFGNMGGNTPFLDSLSKHSLLFTNLYATGTRTVRGLEALSLSVPPTPGQSIVRRPHNEDLFSLASVFNEKGYQSKYIYGGYSYFDNMGYFFSHNSYQVVDRGSLSDEEIDYENIWGVADENLFSLSLREVDKTNQTNQPAFVHIMTTSNHRPFTYPEGRIDIPSHTSREGAVKYTDYAIGKFIKEASKKNWYNNTLFIITADHCASSAGKTELPIKKYKIPMIMFSPDFVLPGVQNRLMSQIDIAPTLLGMLNFSYTTKFFGYDINTLPVGKERAFISTYQLLGYLRNDSLVVLAPKKLPSVYRVSKDKELINRVGNHTSLLPIEKEAITWYQTASFAFKNNLMHH